MDLPQLLLFFGRAAVELVQGAQWGGQDEGDGAVADDMRADAAIAGFETAVGEAFEAHAGDVVGGGLFGVADVPVYMVVTFVAGQGGDLCGFCDS